MMGGDIANETPKRVMVTLDMVVDQELVEEKLLGIFTKTTVKYSYNRANLSKFWYFSSRAGVLLELVGYGRSQEDMDQILEDLNNLGTNPFGYAKAYSAIEDVVSELPYRPELLGVVDSPTNALRYGGKYIDIGRVL